MWGYQTVCDSPTKRKVKKTGFFLKNSPVKIHILGISVSKQVIDRGQISLLISQVEFHIMFDNPHEHIPKTSFLL